jgi:conjugal transfer pilus assembly protein TraD
LLAATPAVPPIPIVQFAHVVATWGKVAVILLGTGAVLSVVLRWMGLAWSWGLLPLGAAPLVLPTGWEQTVTFGGIGFAEVVVGGYLHLRDKLAGGDLAERARARIGPMDLIRRRISWWLVRHGSWVTEEGVAVGIDRRGRLVRVPICGSRPVNCLVPGATGSGKTVTMTVLALAAIVCGYAVVVIDPKGDDFMLRELREAASRAGRRFVLVSVRGDAVYNPYEHGSDTEIAGKLLAGETFTEPHYQRLAQRYLGHLVRALRGAGLTISLATLVQYMDPGRLASLARQLPAEKSRALLDYLETLTAQQARDLSGTLNRLAIVAETEFAPWFDPGTPGESVDLRQSLDRGDVVMFRLEADRLPLAAPMVAAAVIQDLVAISSERQHGDHRPALLVMDEFSGFAAKAVQRLFSRGRGAGFSQLLGAQELADMAAVITEAGAPNGIRDQVLGNLDVVISHRQAVPESAELIAQIAGTRGAWITTHQTGDGIGGLRTGLGSRVRGREYVIHPDDIKRLRIGQAAVIVSRLRVATIVRIFHPADLRRGGWR